jgi:hypothetical protein
MFFFNFSRTTPTSSETLSDECQKNGSSASWWCDDVFYAVTNLYDLVQLNLKWFQMVVPKLFERFIEMYESINYIFETITLIYQRKKSNICVCIYGVFSYISVALCFWNSLFHFAFEVLLLMFGGIWALMKM